MSIAHQIVNLLRLIHHYNPHRSVHDHGDVVYGYVTATFSALRLVYGYVTATVC